MSMFWATCQNHGDAAPGAYYDAVILDNPAAYWRFDEFSGTVAADSSGNSLDGTYVATPSLGVPGLLVGESNTSVKFNGSNEYVTAPSVGDVGFPIAAEVLFRLDALPNFGSIIQTHGNTTTYNGMAIVINSAGVLQCRIGSGGGLLSVDRKSFLTPSATIAINTTYIVHAVATDINNVRIFIGTPGNNDWSEVTPLTVTGSATGIDTSSGSTSIAQSLDSSVFVDGVVDEPNIYSSDIGDTRRQAHYDAASGV